MKTKNMFLVLLLIITFGNSDLFAQTVQTTTTTKTIKPKGSYTKKVKTDANYSTQGMPADNSAVKPKRIYTKKPKVDNSTPVATVQNTVSTSTPVIKPKRTYTRSTPAVSNVAPTTTVTPAPTANNVATNINQAKKVAPQKTTYQPTSGGVEGKHQILVGPRGGRYYINKNGNKTYVK